MSKRKWLIFLLVLHFLPWPSSGLIRSFFVVDYASESDISSWGDSDQSSKPRNSPLSFHAVLNSVEGELVYIETTETDSEVKELENEANTKRLVDSSFMWFESYINRITRQLVFQNGGHWQSDTSLFDIKHCEFIVLRC